MNDGNQNDCDDDEYDKLIDFYWWINWWRLWVWSYQLWPPGTESGCSSTSPTARQPGQTCPTHSVRSFLQSPGNTVRLSAQDCLLNVTPILWSWSNAVNILDLHLFNINLGLIIRASLWVNNQTRQRKSLPNSECPEKVLRKSRETPEKVLRNSLEITGKVQRKSWEMPWKAVKSPEKWSGLVWSDLVLSGLVLSGVTWSGLRHVCSCLTHNHLNIKPSRFFCWTDMTPLNLEFGNYIIVLILILIKKWIWQGGRGVRTKWVFCCCILHVSFKALLSIINKPGVAGAVLQSSSKLFN